MFMAGQVGSYIQFLVLVLVLVIYSFTNVFQKQPATCTRCPSSWADRVWCAGRRASCWVRISGRGRPGGPPGQETPEGNGGWFLGRHTRRSFRKRVCPRHASGNCHGESVPETNLPFPLT